MTRFIISQSSLGLVLVAQSERGLRAVLIGDDRAELQSDLLNRIPDATAGEGEGEGDPELRALAGRVIAFIESPTQSVDLPLDIHGTKFQRTVWQALREIRVGHTATYTDVAHQIGLPNSTRAVAAACAANSLAVIIPCHRVVRSDGQLSGYRWGIQRKRALLEKEGAL